MPQGEPVPASAGPARAAGEDKDMCTASEEEGQQYCLRWNNYQSNMTSVFHQLLQNQAFVDVTLACNDLSLKAHKVVLSACSAYFQRLLLENPCSHPTIIMPSDMCFADLQFIIEFVYRGEIDVSQTELQSLLKTAEQLKIKGLCELPDSPVRGAAGSSEPTPPEQGHGKTVAPRRPPTKLRRGATGGGGRLGSGPCSAAKRPRSALDLDCVNIKTEPQQHDTKADPYDSDEVDDKSSLSQLVRDYSSRNDRPGDQDDKSSLIQLVRDYSSRNDRSEDQDDKSSLSQLVRDYSSRNERSDDQEDRSSVGYVAGDGTDIPLVLLETRHGAPHAQDMTNTSILSTQYSFQSFFHGAGMCDEYAPEPPGPSATPVTEPNSILDQRDLSDTMVLDGDVKIKFETLRAMDQCDVSDMDGHVSQHSQHSHQSGHSVTSQNSGGGGEFGGGNGHDLGPISSMLVTPELLGLLPSSSHSEEETYYDMMSDGSNDEHSLSKSGQDSQNGTMGHMLGMGMDGLSRAGSEQGHRGQGGPKTWSQDDMELALDALRNHNMSLTKASATYGIPSTTLWQRAHRLGIDTPKKEGPSKNWSEDSLNNALEALRTGTISANKASKAYGIPSSTLYKIARREGIRLAAPFNAAPTTWSPDDLERALEAIRSGQTSVQRASTEFGIPTGTLYGRCKREGIELSRSNPTPWSEDAMGEALEAVRVGQMSINQAAIHYNLPYSSLYGRFKRGKYEMEPGGAASGGGGGSGSHADSSPETMAVNYQTHHNSNSHVYPPDHIS